MKPSDRERFNADFLNGSFVVLPYEWVSQVPQLGLTPQEFLVLTQILAAHQIKHQDFVSPQELGGLCGMTPQAAGEVVGGLVARGFLHIGERLDGVGTHSNYYDLKPLWERLRGRDPKGTGVEWRKDVITLFEEEFGRPLSGLECEQVRQWLERDGHPEWLIAEALREAVLANKYSFKYIDRILYDWHRNRIRTKQELEVYREGYRERIKGREETAATAHSRPKKHEKNSSATGKDERYNAFYQLFPDA